MTTASNRDGPALQWRKDERMSLHNDLAGVLARDSRYSIQAYVFIFEAIEHTKKIRSRAEPKGKARRKGPRHITGQQLCEGACALAIGQYGLLAKIVLRQWGIRSTSDLGDIVYNLIASGDLERTPTDSRSDFDNVFNLEEALSRDFSLAVDDVA
jgi:uncharacterized repeat protein (TIGR04138 family)